MTAPNMVEAVARIISPNAFLPGQEQWRKRARNKARTKARAAIEAMREPTPEMCQGGGVAYVEFRVGRMSKAQRKANPPWASGSEMTVVWQAMIDCALKEGESDSGLLERLRRPQARGSGSGVPVGALDLERELYGSESEASQKKKDNPDER